MTPPAATLSFAPPTPAGLPFVKPEDYQYFAPLLKEDEDAEGNRVHTLDKGNAEQIMKIITLQSREISLLHEGGAAGGKPGAKKP